MHSGETGKLGNILVLLVFTLTQIGLDLGDVPGVCAFKREVSSQGSLMYLGFDLVGYPE